MNKTGDTAGELAELVLQIGRVAYAEQGSAGLTPAQWIALRYFARANRFSRTVSGFADFHVTTRGTASQTIKSLVRKGCLTRRPSARDGRSVQFDLTASGKRMLADDPLDHVVRAARALGSQQRSATVDSLRSVLSGVELERRRDKPGVCRLCGHLDTGPAGGSSCGLMRESLEENELEQLCSRFEARR